MMYDLVSELSEELVEHINQYLANTPSWDDRKAYAAIMTGSEQIQKHNLDGTIKYLKKGLKIQENNLAGLLLMGKVKSYFSEYEEAALYYDKCYKISPTYTGKFLQNRYPRLFRVTPKFRKTLDLINPNLSKFIDGNNQ